MTGHEAQGPHGRTGVPGHASPRVPAWRHVSGFAIGGAVAFVVDSAVLMLLTRVAGLPALAARIAAIGTAMVASWLINRTITFAVAGKPTLTEFGRFAAVAWTAAVVNYGLFAVFVLAWPGLHPVLAVGIASLGAMMFSYLGMRFGVFTRQS